MRCLRIIRRWFFPLRDEAEAKSTQAINGLEDTLEEIRQLRKERLAEQHEGFILTMRSRHDTEKGEADVIDTTN